MAGPWLTVTAFSLLIRGLTIAGGMFITACAGYGTLRTASGHIHFVTWTVLANVRTLNFKQWCLESFFHYRYILQTFVSETSCEQCACASADNIFQPTASKCDTTESNQQRWLSYQVETCFPVSTSRICFTSRHATYVRPVGTIRYVK